MDIYDEEFHRNLNIAKGLIAQIEQKGDREICTKWIRKLLSIKANDPAVKKNRNHFFRYFLTVLNRHLLDDDHYGYPQINKNAKDNKDKGIMRRWSADKKTYVAAKPIPGKGALVYMAVSKDPSLGWDIPEEYNTYN